MATSPNFTGTVRAATGQVSAANTNRDGTGTIVTIFTAGSSGSRIDRIRVNAAGTTTAGVVRLYLNDGTNTRLWREVLVTAITPSVTLAVFEAEVDNAGNGVPITLPSGWSLRASTHNAETFNIHVFGGDF